MNSPLVVSFGLGVDSLAMLIGMHQRSIRPDLILFADTGSEKPETYDYIPTVRAWLAKVGFPELTLVRYEPKRFKHGEYSSLAGNCLRNATLPSLAFGRKSCSLKWKAAPLDKFVASWAPAKAAWASGQKVRRAIGYDCSGADSKRFAHASQKAIDPKYQYLYPLREWGWDRKSCIAAITAQGLPVPIKSACFMCPASKTCELKHLSQTHLRTIVMMEARALPHLRTVKGLWRRAAMTDEIIAQGLLPQQTIVRLQAIPTAKDIAPAELDSFVAAALRA